MPNDVLNQLRVLRDSIADGLRKDPRYLTLAALDKSIAEISGVLDAAGAAAPRPAPRAPLQFEAPSSAGSAAPHPAALEAAAGQRPPVVHAPTAEPAAKTPAAEADSGPRDEAGDSDDPEPEPARLDAPLAETAPAAEPEPEPEAYAPAIPEPAEPTLEPAAHVVAPDAAEALYDPASVIPPGRASGYVPMQAKPGAALYQPAISVKFGRLPNKVDLRPLMTPVEDQGETRSCVANAVAGAYEYWLRKASKQDEPLSRLFVYYNARWRDDAQEADEGSVIQLAMEGLKTFGACAEADWPFDPHLVLQKPGADAYRDAAPFKVQDMARVPLSLPAWRQALAEGKPIVFGCLFFETFDECTQRGGVVPMPAPDDVARTRHAGHAMCAVGYCDSERVFIVRNSWGPGWGDAGYCYLPYAYILNPTFNAGDCWVFVPKLPSQPPRETWSDDLKPVTNGGAGVDFPVEPFEIGDYAHVALDFFERWQRPFDGEVHDDFARYAALAGKGQWGEMETFDVQTFLASNIAFADISSLLASEFLAPAEEAAGADVDHEALGLLDAEDAADGRDDTVPSEDEDLEREGEPGFEEADHGKEPHEVEDPDDVRDGEGKPPHD